MWFKKKSVLKAEHNYDTEKSADGTDRRTTGDGGNWTVSSTLLSAAEANNYFYLPASGLYYHDMLQTGGFFGGNYWSSSAFPGTSRNAYGLSFSSFGIDLSYGYSFHGYRVGGFE